LEVQGRAVLQPRALTRVRARARAHVWSALAFAAVAAVAVVVVAAQPVRSPWWTYADADASYAASSLNLLRGERMRYLDHPGLPLEELGAIAFGAEMLVDRATGSAPSRLAYIDRQLLDLDRARPVFRGLAIAMYLAGALLSFLLLARLLGHWTWGLAGGLLWFAAPGLIPMSIQFRPDVLLCLLCLVVAYLIGRAVETRSAGLYAAAGLVTGLAMMVKMHAAGMLPALLLAAVWRPPEAGWAVGLRGAATEAARRRPILLGSLAAAWCVLAVLLNADRIPFTATGEQLAAISAPTLLVVAYAICSLGAVRLGAPHLVRRLLDPLLALVAASVLAGLLLPVTLDIPDGLQSLVNLEQGLSGRGINEAHEPFADGWDRFLDLVPRQALLVFFLAAVGAVVGVARRDPRPVAWFVGALVLGVMAEARTPNIHYFAPAFVVSVPAALWLLQRERLRPASLLVWPVIVWIALPALQDRDVPRAEAARFRQAAEPTLTAVGQRLRDGEVALTPSYWPDADTRYFGLVQSFVEYTPPYPYRFIEASNVGAQLAAERGLRLRYYLGGDAERVTGTQRLAIGDVGEFLVRRVEGAGLAVELLEGPGADSLYLRPEARYDPETGYFKNPEGRYFDAAGNAVENPPKRRYVAGEGLWLDAYGDFWDARGNLVRSDPSLRTAP
jgi:hypothetical protein